MVVEMNVLQMSMFDLFVFISFCVMFDGLFSKYVRNFIIQFLDEYLRYICVTIATAYSDYMFSYRYKSYNEDVTIEQFNNCKNKKYIVACHGRNDGVPLPDLLNYRKSTVITLDINRKINPHIVTDLSLPTALSELKCKVDGVIICHCQCCTRSVMENLNLFETIHSILKPEASLILVSGTKQYDTSPYNAVEQYFKLERQYDNEKIIENRYYAYKFGDILKYKRKR